MIVRRKINLCLIFFLWLGGGCASVDDGAPSKLSPTSLIATPASYYSTAKARYLGTKYKENLDRLAERIVRNPKTTQLQFANNISSVGGIGFFTHSATETPDERYLEVVLAAPETFETKGEYSEKVHQLFSRYGMELLAIIAGDSQIFQEKELRGYGLNLTWRTVISEAPTNRVSLARAIIYFHKEKVANFLRQGLDQNELLRDAVIFALDDNGPLELVSYQPKEIQPDFRPAIREANLEAAPAAKSAPLAPSGEKQREATKKVEAKAETAKKESALAPEVPARAAETAPSAAVEKTAKKDPPAAKKDIPSVSRPAEAIRAEESPPTTRDNAAEKLALKRSQAASMRPPAAAAQSAPVAPPTKPTPLPAGELARSSGAIKLPEKSKASDSAAVAPPAAQPESRGKLTNGKTTDIRPEQTTVIATDKLATKPEPESATKSASLAASAESSAKPKPMLENKPAEAVTAPSPMVKAPAAPSAVEKKKVAAPAPTAGKPENRQAEIGAVPASVKPAETPTKASEPVALSKPKVKAKEAARPAGTTPAAPPPAEVAKPLEMKPVGSVPKQATETKQSEIKEIARAPLPAPVALPIPAPKPAVKASSPEPVKSTAREVSVLNVPVVPSTVSPLAEGGPARESTTPSSTVGVAKKDESPVALKPAPPSAIPARERSAEKPATEQLALLRKPEPAIVEKKPLARRVPRPLEGFIIQIAFSDKEKAQIWAEKMEQRGYAVSITEAGGTGALRVRLGNFAKRDDAERQLRSFKQEDMNGIVINLPQAFRPVARSSVP